MGLVPPRPLRPRPEPEQRPPQSVSGTIPWEKHPGPDPVMQAYKREARGAGDVPCVMTEDGPIPLEELIPFYRIGTADPVSYKHKYTGHWYDIAKEGDGIEPCGYDAL